jgi:hypothetical protein
MITLDRLPTRWIDRKILNVAGADGAGHIQQVTVTVKYWMITVCDRI